MFQSWQFPLSRPLCSCSLKTLLWNLAWVAFMMQLLFVVRKKKTSCVSTNCFRLKLEILWKQACFITQICCLVTWYSVPLEGFLQQPWGFVLLSCPSWWPSVPLAQEIPHPDPRSCFPINSLLLLQGWIWEHGSRSAAEPVECTSVCCCIWPRLCIALSQETARQPCSKCHWKRQMFKERQSERMVVGGSLILLKWILNKLN